MISELKLIFLTSVVYFLMVRFKIFNLIQGQMRGQDNMLIQVVKVSSVILMLYLIIHYTSCFRVIEGNTNTEDYHNSIGELLDDQKYPEATKLFIKLLKTLEQKGIEEVNYGDFVDTCMTTMNTVEGDTSTLQAFLKCILWRLQGCTTPEGKKDPKSLPCIVKEIEKKIHKIEPDKRKEVNDLLKRFRASEHEEGKSKTVAAINEIIYIIELSSDEDGLS